MQKVLVIGCPGAGKSTFARALRDATGLPLCYLDMLWHKPDRTNVTPEAFDRALAEWLARPAWIIDGNYSRTLPTRLAGCDTVFFLDYPLNVCLAGVEGRIGRVREDMPWVETEWDPEFRQYILDFGRDQYPRMLALLDRCRAERDVVTFHSRAEADAWLKWLRAGVALRPYRPADCPALAQLFTETVHTVCAADYTPAELDAWAPPEGPNLAAWDASFQAHCTWIAEIGGRIAGFGRRDRREDRRFRGHRPGVRLPRPAVCGPGFSAARGGVRPLRRAGGRLPGPACYHPCFPHGARLF